MYFGSETHSVGRYIVDIDGCLRATDKPFLSPRDILALQRDVDAQVAIVWELNGESILLGGTDRVEMDEDRVAFFRTCKVEHRFLDPLAAACVPRGDWGQEGTRALAA